MKTKIMVFGTFDGIHAGHRNFFRQARALAANPHLLVSVARDVNVRKIKKRNSVLTEAQRLANLAREKLVDAVVLGAVTNYLQHIVAIKPEVIALGYDQRKYTVGLAKKLKERGLSVKIVRLKSYKSHVYKSSLIKRSRKKKML